MSDWEETALNNRHIHNRVGKQGRNGRKGGGQFDVHRTFGSFEIKCPAADKLKPPESESNQAARLEIYNLNDAGNALICEIFLPNAIQANVLLAGSRKMLNAAVKQSIAASVFEADQEEVEFGHDREAGEEAEDSNENESDDQSRDNRIATFEKNSFRSPKFWLRWQGHSLQAQEDTLLTDFGYIIFAGNSCEKFQGTISCKELDWDNVKITGWKTSSESARDFADFIWHDD